MADPLRFIGEQHRVTVEGDAQLLAMGAGLGRGQDGCRSKAGIQRQAHIFPVRRQKQVPAEGVEVLIGRRAVGEGGAHDIQPVVLDGVEDPQSRITRITRQQDHFHSRRIRTQLVEIQQLADQFEGDAGRQHLVFVG